MNALVSRISDLRVAFFMIISREKLALLLMGCVFILAWLSTDHYPPWTAFHSDATAFLALIIYLVVVGIGGRFGAEFIFLLVISMMPLLQGWLGMIYFGGDALVASGYLVGFAFAFHAGSNVLEKKEAFFIICFSFVFMAIASGGVALCQWLGVSLDFLPSIPARVGRAYANFAQPNQFATMMSLAVLMSFGLRERQILGDLSFSIFVVFSVFCITLSQSRAGILEIGLMTGLMIWLKARRIATASWTCVVVPLLALLFSLCLLPVLYDLMEIGDESLRDYLSPGVRWIHWETAAKAIAMQPWMGFGWNQTSVALAHTVNMSAGSGELIEHSHNIFLDLLLWNGVPLGVFIILFVFLWIGVSWFRSEAINDFIILIAFLMVGLHSLVEFPLEYAYVSLPLFFLLGLVSSNKLIEGPVLMSRALWALFSVWLVIFCVGVWDYLRAEERFRDLRMESAGIGYESAGNADKPLVLLSQLDGFLRFARYQAIPGMSDERLDWMGKVAERYGYPPVLFRYALALGLNNRQEAASFALQRICQTQSEAMCEESRSNWAVMQKRYPQLSEVKMPYRVEKSSLPPVLH